MTIGLGQILGLTIEKPAAGGRMIARDEGRIILVDGAIPGERVTARVSRIGKGVVFADTVRVDEPSPDRRDPARDRLCGGCLYAHVAYPRQLELKSQVIADAFGRIARLPLPAAVPVAASPEDGYRMRARLHLRGGRLGFFKEGSHELCDARATRQLLPSTCEALERLAAALVSAGAAGVRDVDVSENADGSERAAHIEAAQPVDSAFAAALARVIGFTGLSCGTPGGSQAVSGSPFVRDSLAFDGHRLVLRRHVLAFFQGNRYLLEPLAAHVAGQIPAGSSVIDLYAGGGLLSLAAAVRGSQVTAVEGDRVSAEDLRENARAAGGRVAPVHRAVEAFTAGRGLRADAVVVDPPRTGLSREALDGAIRIGGSTFVYVSCDIATLARDARRLVDAGYSLDRVDAFDLFPNTPHVETVAVFRR